MGVGKAPYSPYSPVVPAPADSDSSVAGHCPGSGLPTLPGPQITMVSISTHPIQRPYGGCSPGGLPTPDRSWTRTGPLWGGAFGPLGREQCLGHLALSCLWLHQSCCCEWVDILELLTTVGFLQTSCHNRSWIWPQLGCVLSSWPGELASGSQSTKLLHTSRLWQGHTNERYLPALLQACSTQGLDRGRVSSAPAPI